MPNITLSIPEDLHEKMKHHSEIRWSQVVRKTLAEKIELLETLDRIAKKSKLKKEDIDKFAEKIDSAVAKKLRLK